MAITKAKSKKKISKIKFVIVSLVLATSLVLSFALPAYSQSNSLLSTSARRISNTEIWWDNLWEETFNPAPITLEDSDAPTAIVNVPEPPPVSTIPGSPLPVPYPAPEGNVYTGLPQPPAVVNNQSRGNNLSLYFFSSATRTVLAIGLICWLFSYGRAMVESPTLAQGIHTFVKLFTPVVLAIIFISNQGYYSRVLAYGMRNMANSWSEGVMDMTITGYSVRAAIQDQLITEDVKQQVVARYNTCQSINPPEVVLPSPERPAPDSGIEITDAQRKNYEYLECLDKLHEFAQQQLDIAENKRSCSKGICKAFRRLADAITGATEGVKELERFRRVNADRLDQPRIQKRLKFIEERVQLSLDAFNVATGSTEHLERFKGIIVSLTNPSQSFLYFTQWMWISFLELAMFLNGLFAPMFFAVSIIPGKEKMVQSFLIEFLTIGLAKMAYYVVIGIVAVHNSAPNASLTDNTFFMSLGIFAPAVSFAVVTIGGLGAASSYRNQSVGAIAAVGGLVSSGAATIGYSMSRAMDKRR